MNISSNHSSLAFAEEATLKATPAGPWYGLEPNTYPDFGGEIATVARNPIDQSRSRLKGTTTDLDVSGGFNSDLTKSNLNRLLQGLFFASANERAASQPLNGTQIPMTATTTTTYGAASGLAIFLANTLIFASGFTNTANNGLKLVSASTATTVTTTGLVVEASPPAAAKLETVGKQFAAGDLTVTVSSGLATLASTAAALPTDLRPGDWIYIGGDTAPTQFATFARGWARLRTVSAAAYVLDETQLLGGAVPVTDAGATKTIQIFFGNAIRNEPLLASQVRRTYNLERQYGISPLYSPNVQAEYLEGAVLNEMTLNLPGQDKVHMDLLFVACTSSFRTGNTGDQLKTGTRIAAPAEEAFNTSQDYKFGKLSIAPLTSNSAALFAYALDATLTVTNNVTPSKALGAVGAIDVNPGTFEVGGSVTAYFNDVAALAAIRNNADVSFMTGTISAKQVGFIWDVPLLQLANGRVQLEKDSDAKVPLDLLGCKSKFGFTLQYSWFPYLPAVAAA